MVSSASGSERYGLPAGLQRERMLSNQLQITSASDHSHGVSSASPFILKMDSKVPLMAVSRQLNRFERTLFKIAPFLAGLLIAARVGSIVVLTFLHNTR